MYFFYRVAELVSGLSVINGAYPFKFSVLIMYTFLEYFATFLKFVCHNKSVLQTNSNDMANNAKRKKTLYTLNFTIIRQLYCGTFYLSSENKKKDVLLVTASWKNFGEFHPLKKLIYYNTYFFLSLN